MAVTLYWVVYSSAGSTPTAAQVVDGKDATGSAALASGSEAYTSARTYDEATAITSLSPSTSYKVAWAAYDGSSYGNVAESAAITTSALLQPSLFTNSQVFYSAAVSPGAVTLAPSLFTNTQSFYSPTVTTGGVTISPSLFTNSNTFYGPIVSVGAVTLSPALFTNSQIFYGPAVTQGTLLYPSLFSNSQIFYGPTVAPGVTTLTPSLFTDTDTFYRPTVTGGTASSGNTYFDIISGRLLILRRIN